MFNVNFLASFRHSSVVLDTLTCLCSSTNCAFPPRRPGGHSTLVVTGFQVPRISGLIQSVFVSGLLHWHNVLKVHRLSSMDQN